MISSLIINSLGRRARRGGGGGLSKKEMKAIFAFCITSLQVLIFVFFIFVIINNINFLH